MQTTFRGWPSSAIDFYRQLEAENTRPWWLEHKGPCVTNVGPSTAPPDRRW